MVTYHEITTRDKSSGRYHKRILALSGDFNRDDPLSNAQRVLVDERCNLDQAGDFVVMYEAGGGSDGQAAWLTDADKLCQYCFPVAAPSG